MRYLWLDFETTGLDPELHNIIEVAYCVMDDDKKIIAERQFMIYEHDTEDSWSAGAFMMHQKSGLYDEWKRAVADKMAITVWDVADSIRSDLALLPPKNQLPMLAGSSVHFDRAFIRNHMPAVEKLLHHRHMDTSCVERFFMDFTNVEKPERSDKRHRAMDDIKYSIELYRKLGERVK